MNKFPETIKINGHLYRQQYPIDGGMYYLTDDPSVSVVFSDSIALYEDGRITYLWNGIEREWSNAKLTNN